MKVAIDVHYRTTFAKAVSIEFEDWKAEQPTLINEVILPEVSPYIPGQFYKRELPCILKVLELTNLSKVDTIIIDGYVTLDDKGKPGLGRYLYEHLQQSIPIIGIAKRPFKDNAQYVKKIFRGESKQPLYITSIGVELTEVAKKIQEMSGKFRIPTLLKILDKETKR